MRSCWLTSARGLHAEQHVVRVWHLLRARSARRWSRPWACRIGGQTGTGCLLTSVSSGMSCSWNSMYQRSGPKTSRYHCRRSTRLGLLAVLEQRGQLGGQAAGGADQSLAVRSQVVGVDARPVVVAVDLGGGADLEQVAVAGHVLGQQQQVVAVPDPARGRARPSAGHTASGRPRRRAAA